MNGDTNVAKNNHKMQTSPSNTVDNHVGTINDCQCLLVDIGNENNDDDEEEKKLIETNLNTVIPESNSIKRTNSYQQRTKISNNKSKVKNVKDRKHGDSVDEHHRTSTPMEMSSSLRFFNSVVKFFSFRRKKKKFNVNDTNSVDIVIKRSKEWHSQQTTNDSSKDKSRPNKYHSLPNRRKTSTRSVKKNPSQSSKKNPSDGNSNSEVCKEDSNSSKSKSTDENPNMFSRFVRTFSFLYKRNPNSTTNFRRSKSMQHYRQSRSLPNIKYSTQKQSRPLKSPTFSSGSSSASTPKNSSNHSQTVVDSGHGSVGSTVEKQEKPRTNTTLTSINHEKSNSISKTVDRNEIQQSKDVAKFKTLNGPTKDVHNSEGKQSEMLSPSAINHRRHLVSSGLETPAVCGIQNHGNTCFINSVIQCLSNTNPLAEYFVLDHYRDDLAQQSKTLSKKHGTSKGELTRHLALLLQSLWSCMYSSDISLKFKKIVSKYGEQYNGCEQHDAQEFLLWLLDKCHDDLTVYSSHKSQGKNLLSTLKVGGKKMKTSSFDSNVSDETAAVEFLAKYQTLNSSSVIYDLFQGQLRSMLICRNCEYYSKTFDPYLCISVPVPIRSTFTIFINAIFIDKLPNSMSVYGISIEAAAILRELRDKISRMLKIPEKRLILLHIDNRHGMVEFANDQEMVQELFEDYETIYALETPVVEETSCQTRPSEQTSNNMYQQMLTLVWLNRVGIDKEGPIFGSLFTTLVSREISYRKLKSKILSCMSAYMIAQDETDYDKLSGIINLRIRVVNGLPGKDYLSSEVDHPLFVPTVEKALSKTEDRRLYRGPYHLKLMIEWDLDVRQSILVNDDLMDSKHTMFIDKSVELAKECSKLNNRTTLQDCLDIYFRDESLTAENAWMCPMCNSRQQCVKQLSVWSLPDILIIHLKRSRYISNFRRLKINTMIEYPPNGLDMLKYIAQRKFDSCSDSVNSNSSNNSSINQSKLTYRKKAQNSVEETTFNLYAVCCHYGNMQSGHYAAYCKNPVDNCWYLFDDTKVIPVLEETVVTADAYILFYQKSCVSAAYTEPRANPSTSSISSGYLSSLTCSSYNINHWAFQMPPFNYYQQGNNKCNTLPNRRPLHSSHNNPSSSQSSTSTTTNSNQQKSINMSSTYNNNNKNVNSRMANNSSANKHSTTTSKFYRTVNENDNKTVDSLDRKSLANNSYHHTFPRTRSKQASH